MLKSFLASVVIVSALGSAHAATLDGTQRHATGINDLFVDGKTYDVAFTTDPIDTAYPSQQFFSESMAFDADSAIANSFNTHGVTGVINDPTYVVLVPYMNVGNDTYLDQESFNGGHQVGGWELPRDGRLSGSDNYGHNSVAVFSVSAVPLPASAPMFGGALIALGAVGYCFKRKKAAATA